MILPSAAVRYLLTQKTNHGLSQGHSASPSRVRKRNGEYSDPDLEQAAQGPVAWQWLQGKLWSC